MTKKTDVLSILRTRLKTHKGNLSAERRIFELTRGRGHCTGRGALHRKEVALHRKGGHCTGRYFQIFLSHSSKR